MRNCTFSNLGSAYALSVGAASRGVTIVHNTFDELGGGAIKIGNVDDARAVSTDPTR